MNEDMLSLLTHEYVLVLYGVVAWEIAWGKKGQRLRCAIRSMAFGGAIVAFDDEFLARFNDWAVIDFEFWPWYLYSIAGFSVDWVLTKIIFKEKE